MNFRKKAGIILENDFIDQNEFKNAEAIAKNGIRSQMDWKNLQKSYEMRTDLNKMTIKLKSLAIKWPKY